MALKSSLLFFVVFFSLGAFLPDDCLVFDHVLGHTGEPWNDMCDWLASQERCKSHYFPCPVLQMDKWKTVMPHLWMLFCRDAGLPPRHSRGLWVPPPELPQQNHSSSLDVETEQKHAKIHCTISFCSANVNSFHRGTNGHQGKVQYLRQQFISLASTSWVFCSFVDRPASC